MIVPTPMLQPKKGIPSAPAQSSSAASAPSKQHPSAPRFTRLPAAPGGFPPADGDVSRKHLERQQPSTTACCPPSITGRQLVQDLSPCGSEAEGLSPRTSDAGDSDFSCSASSSSSTDLSATTSSPSSSTSPALSTANSFAERPVAKTSGQAEEEPRAPDTPEPPCRCPTTTNTNTNTTIGNTINTPTSPSAAAPCTRRPAQAPLLSPEELLHALRLINRTYEIYNAQSLRQLQRLSDALNKLDRGCTGSSPQAPSMALSASLAPAPAPAPLLAPAPTPAPAPLLAPAPTPAPAPLLAPAPAPAPAPLLAPAPTPLASVPEGEEAAPAPASPRVLPAKEAEAGKELSTATPSEEPADKPSNCLKHMFGKLLRGMFGGCVGRNVEAL
ncbi:hypothetical protein PLESTB_000223800 [Pleodorina starrii]|uniref:Uncharacterized protein n=1 Tax=Pleodorina starrii TaxID=330485 RepID=A0A9W6EY84_9CHLO|nr:hypothetical protein PLESTM_001549900 [Pleodorina starrii]GLC49482.1 hypothetical protein PLESTB_000223800 [Pleodorina starrii]